MSVECLATKGTEPWLWAGQRRTAADSTLCPGQSCRAGDTFPARECFTGVRRRPQRPRRAALAMAFDDDLRLVGFKLNQEKRDGARAFTLSRNRYLTYWLHVPAYADEPALFTWEFAIGEYMDEYGLQVGSNEPLNQYLCPQTDTEEGQDVADVVKAIERVETMFAGMDFGHREM